MLTPEEKIRYDRQILIDGIGARGQAKLKRARVLIAGCGGLGSPAALYLAAVGIGTLRIIDSDKVELSNLNRQILHWEKDLGKSKVFSARAKLRRVNRGVKIEAINATIGAANVAKLTQGCDVIIDAMDNLPTRLLLNAAALAADTPFVHGAVYGLEGRVTTIIPGKTACLGCIYRGVPPKVKFPVLGTTPGIIGLMQATEAIKIITGIGELLTNRLLIYDGLKMEFTTMPIKKYPACPYCGS